MRDDVLDRVAVERAQVERLPVAAVAALREDRVVEALDRAVRHDAAEVQERRAERAQRRHHRLALLGRTVVDGREREHPLPARRLGVGRVVRNGRELGEAAQPLRRLGHEVAPEREQLARPGLRVGGAAEHQRGRDRVQAEGEARDHAEVAATAAHRPEQVGVLVVAGVQQTPVGGDDVHSLEVVDAQPVRAAQPADAAGEREPAHARLRDQPARRGEAEGGGLAVHVAPERAALTQASRAAASTRTARIAERSTTSPPSHTA